MQEIIDDFYTAVEDYLREVTEGKDIKYYSNNIHVSGLDNCPRQVVYEYFNFPKRKRTLAELITLNVGTYLHTVIDKALKKSGKFDVIHNEKKMNKGLPKMFTGKCDNVIVHKETGKRILQDTKSVRANAFKFGFDRLVRESYKKQLNSYFYGLTKMGIDIDLLMITIFDRGGSNTPYITEVEKRPLDQVEDLFALYSNAVIGYRDRKELPPMLDEMFDKDKLWQCDYCLYQGITCPKVLIEKKKK
jgi:hypothetical protein